MQKYTHQATTVIASARCHNSKLVTRTNTLTYV